MLLLSEVNTSIIIQVTALLGLAYLVGSLPTAVWTGKLFFGKDVREHGSGNAGATNTFRVLGVIPGIAVLLIDIFKGWSAIYLISILSPLQGDGATVVLAIGAVVTTVGHIFPVLAGFRGGKGIATLLGIVIALFPQALLTVVGVFLVVFLLSRMVSLGSVLAALTFPFVAYFVFGVHEPALVILTILIAIAVPLTHHRNIRRILQGKENRIYFTRPKPGGKEHE